MAAVAFYPETPVIRAAPQVIHGCHAADVRYRQRPPHSRVQVHAPEHNMQRRVWAQAASGAWEKGYMMASARMELPARKESPVLSV